MIHEPVIAPAEDLQAGRPLEGTTVPFWIYPVAAFFGFAITCVWAAS